MNLLEASRALTLASAIAFSQTIQIHRDRDIQVPNTTDQKKQVQTMKHPSNKHTTQKGKPRHAKQR